MASCTRACLPACLELAATAQRSGSGMLARAAARQCGARGGGALPADDSLTRGGEITDEGMSLNGTGFKELAVQYRNSALSGFMVSCRYGAFITCKRCCGKERRETLERRGGQFQRTNCASRLASTRISRTKLVSRRGGGSHGDIVVAR